MSSGYRDELEALRAQLEASQRDLAEARDDLERMRKARDEAQQRLAEALASRGADASETVRAAVRTAPRTLTRAGPLVVLAVALFVALWALRSCPAESTTLEQRQIIERGIQEQQQRR